MGGFFDWLSIKIENNTNNAFSPYLNSSIDEKDRENLRFVKIYGARIFNCSENLNFIFCKA